MNTIIKYIEFFRLLVIRRTYGFPYQNISILSFFVFALSMSLLHMTFISQVQCLLIIGLSSIGITVLFWKFYTKNFNIIWAFIHNMGVGILTLTTYLHINSTLSNSEIKYEIYKIINIEHQRTGKNNRNFILAVDVKIEGHQKRISLNNGESKKILGTINNWKVKVGLQKGFLGHTIIKSVQALE